MTPFQIDKSDKRQTRLRNGLVTRHAYSVTGLARVRGQLGDTHLVSGDIMCILTMMLTSYCVCGCIIIHANTKSTTE